MKTMQYAVHSGTYSGMVPDAFAIAQSLVNRLHDPLSGEVKIKECHTSIPTIREKQLIQASRVLGDKVWNHSPLLPNVMTKRTDPADIIKNMAWKPALTVIGIEGLPNIANAANVVTHEVKLALSMRIPPNIDLKKASEAIKTTLLMNPPFGAHISWDNVSVHPGWAMDNNNPELERQLDKASQLIFGKNAVFSGQGGSIAMIKDFENAFPQSTIVLTGVLGPDSNAHAPNESLDIEYTKKLTAVIANFLARQE